jgi:hypothetical protein
MKKILAIMLAVIMMLAIVSCSKNDDGVDANNKENVVVDEEIYVAEDGDEFKYATNAAGDYEIIGYSTTNMTPHKVEIPGSISDIDVTGIADGAFKANNRISEIVIPDTVEYIGEFAFDGCTNLAKVTMGNAVTEIGVGAFSDCIVLTDVTLSSELTKIDRFTFWGCLKLEKIVIPAKATEIGAMAFADCVALKDVTIGAAVKTIGDLAFDADEALVEITIPATVENIGRVIFGASNETVKIVAAENSVAQAYATANGYAFEKLA